MEQSNSTMNVNFVNALNFYVDHQFQRFCSTGSLFHVDGSCHEVVLLRDSGSMQSLVRKDLPTEGW